LKIQREILKIPKRLNSSPKAPRKRRIHKNAQKLNAKALKI
jgi:hypothetical protein